MKNVIIFGLGAMYRKYTSELHRDFNVVAYTSNNVNDRDRVGNYIRVEQIKDYDYDLILICCDADAEIYTQLVEHEGIEPSKIMTYREIFNNGTIFRGQDNEDLIAMFILRLLGITKDFYYLDLGSHHPIWCSNTYAMSKCGGGGTAY